ncbi:MAG: hypothetical protein I8H71_09030 [Xanthomonadaceae bacterium]|nr:hypothetical protein [Xanthomonadaceae bacterium]
MHSSFHGPEHHGGLRESNHFQRTNGLVKLLSRNAQLAGIYRCQIGTARCICVLGKALECFGGSFQRLGYLVENPSQRAQVIHDDIGFGGN